MANRIYRVVPAETPKTFWAKLLDFIEHPLAVGALFAVGGLVGTLLSTPFLTLCAVSVVLAFHRVKVVAGQPLFIQVASYLLLISILSWGGYLLYDGLSLKLDAVQTEFAKKVASLVKDSFKELHTTSDAVTAQPGVGAAQKSEDAKRPSAPLPSTLPSSYIQTFDAGACELSQKSHTDTGYGLFSGLEVVLRECEYTSDGQRAVIRFPSLNWSAVHVVGLVPKTYKGKSMQFSLGWLVEWSDVDAMNRSIEWDIYSSCGEGDLQLLSKASVNILQPPSVVESTAIGSLPSCKAGERYVIRIARDGQADKTQSIASLLRAQVDFR